MCTCVQCIGLQVYARRPIPVYHLGLYTHVGLYIRHIMHIRPIIQVYDPVYTSYHNSVTCHIVRVSYIQDLGLVIYSYIMHLCI